MLKLNYFLFAAMLLAFIFPEPGIMATGLILPFLAGSLFFSLITSRNVCSFRIPGTKVLINGFLYNYVFLSGIMLLFAFTLQGELRDGLILYAICPPGIAMMVISKAWGGKYRDIFGFQLVTYTASILLIPIASIFLFGEAFDPIVLLKDLLFVFGIPALLTCLIKVKNTKLAADLAHLLLALVIYISLSVAQESIVNGFQELALVSLVMFVLALVPAFYLIKVKKDIDAALYSFLKNGAIAAGLSIFFLGPESTLLISIKILIDIIVVLILGKVVDGKRLLASIKNGK